MKTRIENELIATRNVLVEYPKRYKSLQEELSKIDSERSDLLHVIELGSLNAVQRVRLAGELRDLSIKRRLVKNDIELLKEVTHFAENGVTPGRLNNLIGTIRQVLQKQEKRSYRLRVRNDLQDFMK